MNKQIVTETAPRLAWQELADEYASKQTFQQLASEGAAMEVLELEDRVRDLEADLVKYREIATVGIHQLHEALQREEKLKAYVEAQRDQIRDLRELSDRALCDDVGSPAVYRPLPPFDAYEPQVLA